MANPIARQEALVVQELDDEVLIYDMQANKAYCLNRSAAAVWRFCDGTNAVSEIARRIAEQQGVRVEDDLVWMALRQLEDSDLLDDHVEPPFSGHSRRQVIKAIGTASAITLPLVASLVVPATPGGIPLSCGCVAPGDCVSMPQCPSTNFCNNVGQCAPLPRAQSA